IKRWVADNPIRRGMAQSSRVNFRRCVHALIWSRPSHNSSQGSAKILKNDSLRPRLPDVPIKAKSRRRVAIHVYRFAELQPRLSVRNNQVKFDRLSSIAEIVNDKQVLDFLAACKEQFGVLLNESARVKGNTPS